MKKLINAVIAAAALLACALPCYAAEVSPVTGDITMYVVIALIGHYAFGEALGLQKIAAIALIAGGVALLATA